VSEGVKVRCTASRADERETQTNALADLLKVGDAILGFVVEAPSGCELLSALSHDMAGVTWMTDDVRVSSVNFSGQSFLHSCSQSALSLFYTQQTERVCSARSSRVSDEWAARSVARGCMVHIRAGGVHGGCVHACMGIHSLLLTWH
jgi:hypothetical protein